MEAKIKVSTKYVNFAMNNCLGVEAGSTGPMGGHWGKGGRTVLRFINTNGENGSFFCVHATKISGKVIYLDDVKDLIILMGGDDERESLIQALDFAVKVLRGDPVEADQAREFCLD